MQTGWFGHQPLPACIVAREACAPATFADEGNRAVEGEKRIGWTLEAIGAPRRRVDGERDGFGCGGYDGGAAPVFAAAQDESCSEGQ